MNNINDIVYFELNNWFCGRDYPVGEPFETWVEEKFFFNEEWCKKNHLCVVAGLIDMSFNWCITASKEWVIKNCPKLLSQETYEYKLITSSVNANNKVVLHTKSYSDFLKKPDEDGIVYGQFGWEFLPYNESNFGVYFMTDE